MNHKPKALRSNFAAPLVYFVVAVLGCERGPEMVPLNGLVLYKDSPLEFGSVMFQPLGGGEIALADKFSRTVRFILRRNANVMAYRLAGAE